MFTNIREDRAVIQQIMLYAFLTLIMCAGSVANYKHYANEGKIAFARFSAVGTFLIYFAFIIAVYLTTRL